MDPNLNYDYNESKKARYTMDFESFSILAILCCRWQKLNSLIHCSDKALLIKATLALVDFIKHFTLPESHSSGVTLPH